MSTTPRNRFEHAAAAYARRHPGDTGHLRALAVVAPDLAASLAVEQAAARRPLDLRAARAALATERAAQAPQEPPAPPPAAEPAPRAFTHPLNLGPIRAAAAAERALRTPPVAPPDATQFAAGGTWRWVRTGAVPQAAPWLRLAAELVAAGPLQSLELRPGRPAHPADPLGATHFRSDEHGATCWAVVEIDTDRAGRHLTDVIRHEIAHVADELVELEHAGSITAWHGTFRDPHRDDPAEAFAVSAEDWLTPATAAAELLAAARRAREATRA